MHFSTPNLRQTCRVKISLVLKNELRVNNQPHGEELCKKPVDVHALCKQPENIQHQKEVRLKNDFMHDTGFHFGMESNNADCGNLIDLMEPKREPSTILFSGNVTCQGQRLWMTTLLFGEYWFGYALVRGNFFFPGTETCGKTVGKPWGKTEGNFVWKLSPFWLHKNRGQISKTFRDVFAAFFAEDFEASFAEVIARGSINLRSTREAVGALRQFSEDTKPGWLLWSKCSSPLKPPLSRNTREQKGCGVVLSYWSFGGFSWVHLAGRTWPNTIVLGWLL